MKCPNYIDEHGGICVAHGFLYSPNISEREHYCSSEDFEKCPIVKSGKMLDDRHPE